MTMAAMDSTGNRTAGFHELCICPCSVVDVLQSAIEVETKNRTSVHRVCTIPVIFFQIGKAQSAGMNWIGVN